MTPEAKGLKLAGIVTMFAGIAVIILGIVFCVMDFDVTDALVAATGVGDAALGASAARKANVPSTAKTAVVPALIIGALCIAAGVTAQLFAAPIVSIAACCAAGVLAAVVSLSAQRIVKALERI